MRTNIAVVAFLLFVSGCQATKREVGQVEFFKVLERAKSTEVNSGHPQYSVVPLHDGRWQSNENRNDPLMRPSYGDRIRHDEDVVTIQVHSAYIDRLPATLTGSKDVVLFAETWENASESFQGTPLTSIVYIGRNQMVPGLLNFSGNLAYGPTRFKGHPMRIRFTLMLLQKEKGQQQANALGVLESASLAIPTYGVIASQSVRIFRDLLRAQPDIITFDYELTLLSDNPEKHTATVLGENDAGNNVGFIRKNNDRLMGLEASLPWLQYGMFALLETKSRKKNENDTSYMPPYYFRNGGVFLDNATEPPVAFSNKFLTFSITPGQLPENDEILEAATKANNALLSQIRQDPQNIENSVNSINSSTRTMLKSVIEIRLESIAREARQKAGNDNGLFEKLFAEKSAPFKESLARLAQNTPLLKSEIEALGAATEQSVREKWGTLMTGEGVPTSMPGVYKKAVENFVGLAEKSFADAIQSQKQTKISLENAENILKGLGEANAKLVRDSIVAAKDSNLKDDALEALRQKLSDTQIKAAISSMRSHWIEASTHSAKSKTSLLRVKHVLGKSIEALRELDITVKVDQAELARVQSVNIDNFTTAELKNHSEKLQKSLTYARFSLRMRDEANSAFNDAVSKTGCANPVDDNFETAYPLLSSVSTELVSLETLLGSISKLIQGRKQSEAEKLSKESKDLIDKF